MSSKKSDKPLIPYIRQSKSKDKVKVSPEEQLRDITRWADAAGVGLAEPVEERGVSGSKTWRKRELGAAIERCRAGEASGVIVAYQSRLSRENGLGTAEVFDEMGRAGIRLVCVAENIDTAATDRDPADTELFFALNAAIARREWRRAQANSAKSRRNGIENGVHQHPAPFGYTRPPKLEGQPGTPLQVDGDPNDPATPAGAVVAAFKARAAGASWTKVRELIGPDREGKPCSRKRAANLLASRTFLGEARSGEFVKANAHPALVTLGLFNRANDRSVKRTHGNQRRGPALLTGVIRCGTCGGKMTRDWKSVNGGRDRVEFYRCWKADVCDGPASVTERIAHEHVGSLVIEQYLGVFEEAAAPQDRSPELEAAVAGARDELADVEALRGKIAPAAYGRALSAAIEAVEAAEAELQGHTPLPAGPPRAVLVRLREVAERDNEEALALLRDLVNRLVERVEVRRGRGLPVEEKVTVVWRDGSFTPSPDADADRLVAAA